VPTSYTSAGIVLFERIVVHAEAEVGAFVGPTREERAVEVIVGKANTEVRVR
jgi:hypothetical protein